MVSFSRSTKQFVATMETKEIGIEPTPLGFVQKNVALLVPNAVVLNQCAVDVLDLSTTI